MNIYESITAIMQEGYSIGKEKRNQQQGFLYRGIDDVMNTFQPLLSKYRVFCVPEVLSAQREERQTNKGGLLLYSVLTIRYTFYAEDGSSVSAVVIGEGMDSGDKASNKAMAVGMKYAMFQTFCIPTEEMRDADPDRVTPDAITPKAPEKKEAGKFACNRCGAELKPVPRKSGGTVSLRQWDGFTNRHYGQSLCLGCLNKFFPDWTQHADELT